MNKFPDSDEHEHDLCFCVSEIYSKHLSESQIHKMQHCTLQTKHFVMIITGLRL